MNKLIRNLAVLGAFGAGLASQASAVTVSFHYDGNLAGSPVQVVTGTNFINEPGVGDNATGLTYTYNPTVSPYNGSGTLTLTGGILNFTFVATNDLAGAILTITGVSGNYVGYTGSGLFSHSVNSPTTVAGQFDADIAPVPEPASMLAMGVGAVSLLRRRARKAN